MSVNSATRLMVLVLLLLPTSGAIAAPTASLPSPVEPAEQEKSLPTTVSVAVPLKSPFDIEKLERVQGETILLEAQALKAKAEMAASSGVNDATQSPALIAGATSTLPRINEIAGSGNTLGASLTLPDASEVYVWKGQTIAGTNLTVSNITSQGVIVTLADGSTASLPMNDE